MPQQQGCNTGACCVPIKWNSCALLSGNCYLGTGILCARTASSAGLLILCISSFLVCVRPEGSSVSLVHLKYQLSPCCENWSIAEQGFFFFLHWLNPKRKGCCCEKQSLGLVMFLLSSLKLFMLDHEQPTSSPAYPGAEACGETIILRLPSQCLSHIAWFYQSNTVLSLQEKQQQGIAMVAEVSKCPIIWQWWTNSKLIFTL